MKLIKLSETHYIIVDNSVITDVRPFKGRFHYEKGVSINKFPTYLTDLSECKIITHSTEPIEEKMILSGGRAGQMFKTFDDIKQLNLSEVQELIYGYSVEKMANEKFPDRTIPGWVDSFSPSERSAYIVGFNKALELNKDMRFNTEFIIYLVPKVLEKQRELNATDFNDWYNSDFLRMLFPKTEWDVEFDGNGKLRLI